MSTFDVCSHNAPHVSTSQILILHGIAHGASVKYIDAKS